MVDISIKNGEGISQAIMSQLVADGGNASEINGSSKWNSVFNLFQAESASEDKSTLEHNGEKKSIGDLWTNLQQNVSTAINDVLHISDTVWAKIKEIFGINGLNQTSGAELTDAGDIERGDLHENLNKDNAQELDNGRKSKMNRFLRGNGEVNKANATLKKANNLLYNAATATDKSSYQYQISDTYAEVNIGNQKIAISIVNGEIVEVYIRHTDDKNGEYDVRYKNGTVETNTQTGNDELWENKNTTEDWSTVKELVIQLFKDKIPDLK